MAIYKHTFMVTVLNDDPDYDVDDLSSLHYDITDGDSIGHCSRTNVEEIPSDRVQAELEEIGNDGTFFGSVDDENI